MTHKPIDPFEGESEAYIEHRTKNPLLYEVRAIKTNKDWEHFSWLKEHGQQQYILRAEYGQIALRDAVAAVKRQMKREERKMYEDR